MTLKAVFFDRDGVLIEDKNYLADPDQVTWVDGARELVAELTQKSILRLIVTNQSGVARGYFELADVDRVHDRMIADLGSTGSFSGIAICPHLPEGTVTAYSIACGCRKPLPGMLVSFLDQFGLDPKDCCMIGDKQSDLAAAQAAGIQGFLFDGGNLKHWFDDVMLTAGGFDYV